MRRDSRGSTAYWNEWIAFSEESIQKMWERLKGQSGNPTYRPQYVFELSKHHYELLLQRYSRGDPVNELAQYFAGLLDAWEFSERLGAPIWDDKTQHTRNSWTVNLDHYVRCFWLTGLALALNIPDDQWQRLVALMGNEGEDALLDRVIASRQLDRKIGDKLCFPKAYQRLLEVVDAQPAQRPGKLRAYLDHWFQGLENAGHPSFPRDHRTPYWWIFCANEELGMRGGYFGCWCIEAVAVAKAFGIDDGLCLSHPHYPGDLLQDDRSPRYPDTPAPPQEAQSVEQSLHNQSRSWLDRILRRT